MIRLCAAAIVPVLLMTAGARAQVGANPVARYRATARYAIVVGVSAYTSGWRPLDYAANDASGVARVLSNNGYSVTLRIDSDATRGHLLDDVEAVRRSIAKRRQTEPELQTLVLFFFSGHGYDVNGESYIAAWDSRPATLDKSGVSLTEYTLALEQSGADQRVLIVDACRNSPLKNKVDSNPVFRSTVAMAGGDDSDPARPQGTRLLFSTRARGVSWEDSKLLHGVFSYYFIRELDCATVYPALVTFRDVAERVQRTVPRYGLELGRPQYPYDGGSGFLDFPLSEAARPCPPEPERRHSNAREITARDGLAYRYISTDVPLPDLRVDRPFFITATEVTVGAYKKFAGEDPERREMPEPPVVNAEWMADVLPMVNITWQEANSYCSWALPGGSLPTEAQWEYVARRGATTDPPAAVAWFFDNSGLRVIHPDREYPTASFLASNANAAHPVGSRKMNSLGVFDLQGNVSEWVSDWFGTASASLRRGPSERDPGNRKVTRGGSFLDSLPRISVTARRGLDASSRSMDLGFRCVADAADVPEGERDLKGLL